MNCTRRREMRRWWGGLLGALQLLATIVGPALAQPQELTG